MAPSEIQVKLLVDNKTNKVLFAEAGKDFVHTTCLLFALLRLPVGLMMLAAAHPAGPIHGSFGRLYKSVDDMDDDSYFLPNVDKDDQLLFPDPPTKDESYVNEQATYMVTDGLEVTPVSAISSIITLFNRFRIGNDVDLAEKIVAFGMGQWIALLKAALRSDTVLSDVFLATKKSS